MKNKQAETLIIILSGVSSFILVAGAFLKIMHYPHGYSVLMIGFTSNIVLSTFENIRLKKIIKSLEKDKSNVDVKNSRPSGYIH